MEDTIAPPNGANDQNRTIRPGVTLDPCHPRVNTTQDHEVCLNVSYPRNAFCRSRSIYPVGRLAAAGKIFRPF